MHSGSPKRRHPESDALSGAKAEWRGGGGRAVKWRCVCMICDALQHTRTQTPTYKDAQTPKFDQLVDFARAFILVLNARHVSIFTWCECAVNKAKFQFHQQKIHCNRTLERLQSLECCMIIFSKLSLVQGSRRCCVFISSPILLCECVISFLVSFFRLLLLFTVAFLYFIVLNFILSPVFHVLFISFCVPVNVPNSGGWVSLMCLVQLVYHGLRVCVSVCQFSWLDNRFIKWDFYSLFCVVSLFFQRLNTDTSIYVYIAYIVIEVASFLVDI